MARIGRLFIPTDRIAARVGELGAQISATAGDDVLLVTLLKGGVPFLADLVRCLPPSVMVDFLALSRFVENAQQPGVARLVKDLDAPIEGRHVVVVENVLDTGLSLSFLLRLLRERDPASLRVCALLDREAKRIVDLHVDFKGFDLGDEYLVGYGLDFLGLYRNLPCLVAVDDLEAARADPSALVPQLRDWGVWS